MKFLTRAATALAVVLLGACGGKQAEPKALPAPPSIKSFTADKDRVEAGDPVTLTFTTENATSAELLDASGASIFFEGGASSGTATVSPKSTTFFVLRVKGEGGRDNAFVPVGVGENLGEVFFASVPPEIESGESSLLLWSAAKAKSVKIIDPAGKEIVLDPQAGSGELEVTPARTTAWSLVAVGAFGKTVDASATVKVRPTLDDFQATPQAAKAGETLTLSWKTRGASQVVLSESTFGELARFSAPETPPVDDGTFDWTVPETLPTGAPILDGRPLRFKLTVTQANPDVTLTRSVDAWVGTGPQIVDFTTPVAVTEGKPFTASWKVTNAVRVQLFANGALVYEPLPGSPSLSQGTLKRPPLLGDTDFELVAWSHTGARTSKVNHVRRVKAPSVDSFHLPSSIASPGSAANANWTTQNATGLAIRVKDGPTVFNTLVPAKISASSAQLYPGLRTTFVLEAWNDAGDLASREGTVEVSSPGQISASPTPTVVGNPVEVTWTLDGSVTEVIGEPIVLPTKSNPATLFYDLDQHTGATKVVFTDPNSPVAELKLSTRFTFPFVGTTREKFFVSLNGFLTFAKTDPLPDNGDLSGAAALPAMLAPFWDELSLGADGEVLFMIEGTTFPRRLIVQWNKVHTDETSELSFQVQLLETGEFRFEYKTLTGLNSAGEDASIGWYLDSTHASAVAVTGSPNVAAGDEMLWFTGGAPSGMVTLNPRGPTSFTLFGRLQNGGYVVFPARINALASGSVLVNEAMPAPDTLSVNGQWIELSNEIDSVVDLSDTVLTSTATGTSWTLPPGTLIPAHGHLVVGQSTDPSDNGEAGVELAWNGLTPSNTTDDEIVLSASGIPLASLGWSATTLTQGTSVQPADWVMDAAGAKPTCVRTHTFGLNGAIGTPGATNETCFDYRVSMIPVDYEDISMTGTPLFTGTNMDYTYMVTTFTDAPFTYFGQAQTTWSVASDGYLIAGPITYTTSGNKAKPNTNYPKGAIAVFWDDLKNGPAADANAYSQRMPPAGGRPGYWIIQWHHFSHYFYGTTVPDDLNFQAKLFDDGAIEFHYAAMVSGTSMYGSNPAYYAGGTSATTWLERPAGDLAFVVGANSALGGAYLTSNVAYRFTPKTPVHP